MRILLLGKCGQLGWELHRTLQPLGEVIALDYPEIDLTSPDSIRATVQKSQPELIINAAAYTDVERAEREPEIAMAVNGNAPGLLAEQAQALCAGLIHYSTDYVFDGKNCSPYVETDKPNPINVYGRSKLEGERSVSQVNGSYLIFRTSWVYSLRGVSFVTKVLSWAREQETLRIVEDQIGSPTWARMLAEITAQLILKGGDEPLHFIEDKKGIFHLAGSGTASRLDWVRAILQYDPNQENQMTRRVLPVKSKDFPDTAKRPPFSALNCNHFFDIFDLRLPEWKNTLRLALDSA
ncbi:dTDP-4-dehydrorhamnose reductase [Chloroflexota bacterium]